MNLTNQLLIANPDMPDERFVKAVILICEHNENGALGIDINHPSDVTINEIFQSLEISALAIGDQHKVYEGGPVNTQCGFILHQHHDVFDSSIRISKEISLTTSKDIIQAIADNQLNSRWLLALGCATWHEGQLEQEMADNAWLTCPADDALVFTATGEDKWTQALNIIGIKPHQLSGDLGHA
ncbi:MAG: YqgE/AlgH family protein [Xanthomonadales bacterium]|nr:YqgE/AlgH family protein [Xanthomonadales bacterium]